MPVEFLAMLAFPALMIFAGAMDMFTMTIPNRVPLAIVATFAAAAPLAGLGWEVAAMHAGLALAMLVVGIGMFAAGWMGGGDVKLLAAAALWMGPASLYDYILVSAVCGGLLTFAILFLRMYPLPAGLAGKEWVSRLHDAEQGIPYGIALTAGGLLVYPYVEWIQALNQA